jgi:hypothetical protein
VSNCKVHFSQNKSNNMILISLLTFVAIYYFRLKWNRKWC